MNPIVISNKLQSQFDYVINLIAETKQQVYQTANTQLLEMYWNIGEYLYQQVEENSWGKSIIKQLSQFIQDSHPNIKGFSSQNLWRMKQLFEYYKDFPKLSTLLREIPWSHNMRILSSAKSVEENEFYIRLVIKERLSLENWKGKLTALILKE
jgi:predicted nuclease of restriction endonuclease-like (RecB) superfamily